MTDTKQQNSEHRKRSRILGDELEKRLLIYAVTAGAAGVGILMAGQPLQADIIVTSANKFVEPFSAVYLDLNHDGVPDLQLGNYSRYSFHPRMRIRGLGAGNSVVLSRSGSSAFLSANAARLALGVTIGSRRSFHDQGTLGGLFGGFPTYYQGRWAHGGKGFLGLRFDIDGQVHYGWAQLVAKLVNRSRYEEFLIDYAYDTVANQAILAGQTGPNSFSSAPTPEPGTLGLLALGSLGLGFWRRKNQEPEARSQNKNVKRRSDVTALSVLARSRQVAHKPCVPPLRKSLVPIGSFEGITLPPKHT